MLVLLFAVGVETMLLLAEASMMAVSGELRAAVEPERAALL
jgi:hypothetical protein